MNEKIRDILVVTLRIALYIFFVVLTIIGVRDTGWANLGLQFIGLAGVIVILWRYNARNQ